MTQLNQAVVLLTGAAGGFGQELTRQLLQAGSRLILTDLDAAALWQQAKAIQATVATGEIITCLTADLSDLAGCDQLYRQVKALDCAIDILINNAGIALYGRIDEVPPEKWERLMQVNLLAPMRLSALFAAEMIARRQGHIVNISSVAGWVAQAGLTYYSTSKFGLRGFSEGLCHEVKPYNVQVTVVYPFFSRTPILHAEKFGTLGERHQGIPDYWVTDPAKVMAVTLQAIRQNQLHVFPDPMARIVQRFQRYTPNLLDWMSNVLTRRQQGGSSQ
ncbi:MAG: SDR family NAD(P)-dependent oxidoreductase [Leptolyngbyaceae cyanobacterium bins.349]|nr:SDR family NAD(P)-dependent oxidoreductase [Leptolyngbyaceae cyanobacterium bins.349]